MRKGIIAVLAAFGVTLAIVVGNRMSAEAMAVVVGVVCGVAAAIPMSLLLLFVLTRRERPIEEPPYAQPGARYGAYPPVVVIQGGTSAPNGLLPPYYSNPVEAAPRQFHIVGEEE